VHAGSLPTPRQEELPTKRDEPIRHGAAKNETRLLESSQGGRHALDRGATRNAVAKIV
jgi:hypothetical protein